MKPIAPTVREHARNRGILDGANAQALEHALTITERERDEARRERDKARVELDEARKDLAAAKLRVSDLKLALGADAQGWFDRFKRAQAELAEMEGERDTWKAAVCPPLDS